MLLCRSYKFITLLKALDRTITEGGSYSSTTDGYAVGITLLVCLTAGFVVANFTSSRLLFLRVLDVSSPYIYVAFFTLTGANLRVDTLVANLPAAAAQARPPGATPLRDDPAEALEPALQLLPYPRRARPVVDDAGAELERRQCMYMCMYVFYRRGARRGSPYT